jgi:GYF domain 2/Domain of unknown function (DUF4190)
MYRIIGADGREYGPISVEQMRQWIAEGRLNAESRVRSETAADWVALGSIPELAALLALAPTPPTIGPGPAFPAGYPRRTHPLATAGLVLGILSLPGFCCCYGLPFNVAGIVCSAVALHQINRQPQVYSGQVLAIVGLALSILSLFLSMILVLFGTAYSWHNTMRQWRRL